MPNIPLPELPTPFLTLLDAVVPANHRAMVDQSYTEAKLCHFRLNPLLAEPASTLADLAALSPAPLNDVANVCAIPASNREQLTNHPTASDGRIYIQGLSSMAAVWALAPQPEEEILDLAAAPGGKTTYIAALMNNTGRLAAVEPVKARYFRLKANLERMGVRNAHTYWKDGVVVGRLTPARFDRVLLDAPCSSEAQFTRLDPDSWAHWSPRKVKECARLQGKLLRSAVAALKPGGTLVYSTCSLSPEENECVVDEMLRQHPEMEVQPLTLPAEIPAQPGLTTWAQQTLDPRLAQAWRILPSDRTDAFFLCKMQKSSNAPTPAPPPARDTGRDRAPRKDFRAIKKK